MSKAYLRDGSVPMQGPINMNGFAINNIAPGSSANSVATVAQSIPIGAIMDFGGFGAPAGWALCYGQELSRVTYAALFALVGTAYGAGNGSSTFNIPDLRGRVTAGRDEMGGISAGRLTGFPGGVTGGLGSAGGLQFHALDIAQMPSHLHSNTLSDPGHAHATYIPAPDIFASVNAGSTRFTPGRGDGSTFVSATGISINNGLAGGDGAHNNVQPTLVTTKIIRISYDV